MKFTFALVALLSVTNAINIVGDGKTKVASANNADISYQRDRVTAAATVKAQNDFEATHVASHTAYTNKNNKDTVDKKTRNWKQRNTAFDGNAY